MHRGSSGQWPAVLRLTHLPWAQATDSAGGTPVILPDSPLHAVCSAHLQKESRRIPQSCGSLTLASLSQPYVLPLTPRLRKSPTPTGWFSLDAAEPASPAPATLMQTLQPAFRTPSLRLAPRGGRMTFQTFDFSFPIQEPAAEFQWWRSG